MNNEPVAWMPIQSKHTRIVEAKPDDEQNWIPLYLHPANVDAIDTSKQYVDKSQNNRQEPSYFGLTNDHTWLSVDEKYYKKLKTTHRMKCYHHPAKTLTDEVLMQLYEVADYSPESYLEEARAILRKAQEK